jgi:pimeloyl-ACP methyl ester carboxylesterase
MNVDVEGARIYVVDEGEGQPVLFLHGNPDSADMWSGVIERLKGKYRCIAIDLPGFGRSEAPASFDATLESEARFVDDLLSALGITAPLDIVGHDFGGHFALAWAISHPEKVSRLVVSNTSFFADYKWHRVGRLLRTPVVGEVAMAATNEAALVRNLRSAAPDLSVEQVKHTYSLYTPAAKKMALRLYRAANPEVFKAWEGGLRSLSEKVPLMVLWGDKDPFVAPGYAERFGATVVHHFPDHSHWLPAEAPAEVAQKLDEFFSEQHAPAPTETMPAAEVK